MWLFCKSGFFSAVVDFNDANRVMVRSRFKGDLERLLPEAQVVHTPHADYPYRAFIPRTAWVAVVQAQAQEMDYDNFKNAVHDGTNRDTAYMGVWSTMRRYAPH